MLLAIMPPLSLGDRWILAGIGVLMTLKIFRSVRPDRPTLRVITGHALACVLVVLMYWRETGYSHWQRDPFVTILIGCLAGVLASCLPLPASIALPTRQQPDLPSKPEVDK